MYISVDQLQDSEKRYSAAGEKKVRESAADFTSESLIGNVSPDTVRGNILGERENLVKRKEMLQENAPEPVDFAYERAIGKNDSVYSNFVDLIEIAKQKVGRIAIKNGNRNIGYATGFMVSENLMLTNWHVFPTIQDVADSELQFFYELDIFGRPGASVIFNLQSNIFYSSDKDLDYCLVAVSLKDITATRNLTDIGYIFLDPSLGKLGSEEKESLNIIHHPDGDYKQLSIRENLFTKITPISIWYKADTAPGSSGSPVFNDQWQVVALHHSGVARKNSAGDYIDKDGNVIPLVNGKIDAARVIWDANEGIRISVILKDLFAKFPNEPIIRNLQKPPQAGAAPEEEKPMTEDKIDDKKLNQPFMDANNASTNSNVHISFPASLVERNGMINISIHQGGVTAAPAKTETATPAEEADLLEVKKLEDSTDFSLCKGYQSRFMGNFDIAIPQPQSSIAKFIAKVNNTDSTILKYYNYSTIFHSVRMMPVISAINVDGDPSLRKDNATRKDVWLRDKRLSFDIQLSDSYYKNSGFDRGHMSRREDADWGSTPEDALRNANLTCMYTNACPQVARINQSGKKGLWGILEKVVLESGAIKENKKTNKISVFNGPIFKDNDPVFRGIQVPMDFFKIVLWLTDDGKLKATAFKLSQQKIVDNINFEELDIDQNTEFKEFQCSIQSLQNATKIDFSAILPFDTFDTAGANEVAINSEIEVMSHINKNNKASDSGPKAKS